MNTMIKLASISLLAAASALIGATTDQDAKVSLSTLKGAIKVATFVEHIGSEFEQRAMAAGTASLDNLPVNDAAKHPAASLKGQ